MSTLLYRLRTELFPLLLLLCIKLCLLTISGQRGEDVGHCNCAGHCYCYYFTTIVSFIDFYNYACSVYERFESHMIVTESECSKSVVLELGICRGEEAPLGWGVEN